MGEIVAVLQLVVAVLTLAATVAGLKAKSPPKGGDSETNSED